MTRRFAIEDPEVATMLGDGAVVAVPTDTVYGVAARLDRPDAVARLFRLKGRPSTVALPVLVTSADAIDALGLALSVLARRAAERFWPGPLTLVVPGPAALARRVGPTSDTVGVRVPDDDRLRDLLAVTGPLAVTSANAHGEPACHDADEVEWALGSSGDLDGIVDAGRRDGAVSTVLEVTGNSWRVLRAGAIAAADLDHLRG